MWIPPQQPIHPAESTPSWPLDETNMEASAKGMVDAEFKAMLMGHMMKDVLQSGWNDENEADELQLGLVSHAFENAIREIMLREASQGDPSSVTQP